MKTPHKWTEVVYDTGGKAWRLDVLTEGRPGKFSRFSQWYNPTLISIAAHTKPPGIETEWAVFAAGCLVGVSPTWADAENLAISTHTLMEASHAERT